ncbi:solute carrier family 22 member 4 [Plakobranchus ocellatus]|uniref:Solute carrier family 22 member 4 n=1 Tax=Plakobranchus ocellatus TaxID=259542 RepID=A0AAV4BPJ4_9GAST|nr:solute carrier family 22 member 4 [Plakobranchus ocellatus]
MIGVAGTKSKAIRWLAFTIRLLTSCSWCAVQAWGTELYPTDIRNIGYGAANTAARVGGILAPFIINLESGAVPTYCILTALTFLMVLVPLTLPETNNKVLQDHLESGREDKHATHDPLMTGSDDHLTSL